MEDIISQETEEAARHIADLMTDPYYWDRMRQMALPQVYVNSETEHTIQMVSTPISLCKDIIGKLEEFTGLNDKTVLVLNVEFLEFLAGKVKELWFFSDNIEKVNYVRVFYPEVKMYIGNFLNWRIDMKFDVVVGNPPYQKSLHLSFLEQATDLSSKYVMFIHPSNWLISIKNNKRYKATKDKIKSYGKTFTFLNANKAFGIGSFNPICVTCIDKSKNDEKATVINTLSNMTFNYDSINDINQFGDFSEYYSLLEKIREISSNGTLEDYVAKDREKKNNESSPYYVNVAWVRGHVSTKNDSILITDDFYTLLPREEGVENCVTKMMYFRFSKKEYAINFISYVKTKVARFCLALLKTDANINGGEFALIPWLDFSLEWTDEKLCSKFGLTEKEWEFIQSVIPDYYNDK